MTWWTRSRERISYRAAVPEAPWAFATREWQSTVICGERGGAKVEFRAVYVAGGIRPDKILRLDSASCHGSKIRPSASADVAARRCVRARISDLPHPYIIDSVRSTIGEEENLFPAPAPGV